MRNAIKSLAFVAAIAAAALISFPAEADAQHYYGHGYGKGYYGHGYGHGYGGYGYGGYGPYGSGASRIISRYMTDEQRSQTGWIGVREWVVILARALSAARRLRSRPRRCATRTRSRYVFLWVRFRKDQRESPIGNLGRERARLWRHVA